VGGQSIFNLCGWQLYTDNDAPLVRKVYIAEHTIALTSNQATFNIDHLQTTAGPSCPDYQTTGICTYHIVTSTQLNQYTSCLLHTKPFKAIQEPQGRNLA
jgi:hypothetical protein